MSLYRCLCGQWYTTAKEVDDLLNTITEENPVVSITSICPECGKKDIIGGESDWYDGGPAIMMFGREYSEITDSELPSFFSVRLIETESDKTGFATWHDGRTINFKKEGI